MCPSPTSSSRCGAASATNGWTSPASAPWSCGTDRGAGRRSSTAGARTTAGGSCRQHRRARRGAGDRGGARGLRGARVGVHRLPARPAQPDPTSSTRTPTSAGHQPDLPVPYLSGEARLGDARRPRSRGDRPTTCRPTSTPSSGGASRSRWPTGSACVFDLDGRRSGGAAGRPTSSAAPKPVTSTPTPDDDGLRGTARRQPLLVGLALRAVGLQQTEPGAMPRHGSVSAVDAASVRG